MSPIILAARLVKAWRSKSSFTQSAASSTCSKRLIPSEMLALVGTRSSRCARLTVMPCPVCCDEAIQRLVFANSFQQSVSRSLVVTTLDVERVEPGLEDQRCEDRHPGLAEIDEGLVRGKLSCQHGRETPLEVRSSLHITVVEANRCPSVFDLRCLLGVPVWDVRVAWFVHGRSKLEVCVGVDYAV